MTGSVTLEFTAQNLQQASEHTLAEWRRIIGDEEAELPWSVHFLFESGDEVSTAEGVVAVGSYRVIATIEFDRTAEQKKPSTMTVV